MTRSYRKVSEYKEKKIQLKAEGITLKKSK